MAFWGAVIGGVVSAWGASESANAEQDNSREGIAARANESRLGFNRQAWAAQLARRWQLEDQQREINYKEDAIGSFRQFAPAGMEAAAPARTQISTTGLADWNPETGSPFAQLQPQPTGRNSRTRSWA